MHDVTVWCGGRQKSTINMRFVYVRPFQLLRVHRALSLNGNSMARTLTQLLCAGAQLEKNACRCRRRHRLSNIRMSACKPSPIFVVEYIVSCAPVVLFFYYCHEKTFHLINALDIFKVKCMQPLLLIYRRRSIFFCLRSFLLQQRIQSRKTSFEILSECWRNLLVVNWISLICVHVAGSILENQWSELETRWTAADIAVSVEHKDTQSIPNEN